MAVVSSSSRAAGALAVDRAGAGPVLVLLHPLGADRHVWAPVIDRLAAEREVVAVDLPGFGHSPPLAGGAEATPAALAAAVAAELDRLGLEDVHVAGNSLGGWVALEMALAGRARSVCAISPAGLWPEPLSPRRGTGRAVLRALRPLLPLLVRSRRVRRAILSLSVAHPDRVPYRDALALLRAYAGAPGFRAANDAMRAGRFAALGRIAVPVTLAWPSEDRMIARPRALPPGLRSVTLHGCGHIPMWDDPEQVARVLLEASSGDVVHAAAAQRADGTARPANSDS